MGEALNCYMMNMYINTLGEALPAVEKQQVPH